jgi:hypothetical protein
MSWISFGAIVRCNLPAVQQACSPRSDKNYTKHNIWGQNDCRAVTDPINYEAGIRQGDFLSLFVFNIMMDEIIKK